MIEIILFAAGCMGGLVLGYVFGHSRGYKACANDLPFPLEPPDLPAPFPLVDGHLHCYSYRLKIPKAVKPEDRIRLATSAAMDISEKLARLLLANKVIRPVILDSHSGPYDAIVEIGASIYAMANPTFNDYPPLVFFHPEST
ncbi:hypothetical protein [uncultured Duncaniella sp.]|uniref:hypothetical protein n=1 Tax=uncultured Duncaniella sp. TaxID=2768039 RepID=UPI00272C18B8|nr:hypothetical protein [uncultured Duncaniella sp.]